MISQAPVIIKCKREKKSHESLFIAAAAFFMAAKQMNFHASHSLPAFDEVFYQVTRGSKKKR
jgi:hypothetical protein